MDALGETAEDVGAKVAELRSWAMDEKPPREAEKASLQDGLRAINLRRVQEDRPALPAPATASALEDAWAALEREQATLEEAFEGRRRQLERREALAATDAQHADADARAATWLQEVDGESERLREGTVASGGRGADETQALLDTYRGEVLGVKRPRWAEQHVRRVP